MYPISHSPAEIVHPHPISPDPTHLLASVVRPNPKGNSGS